MQRGSVNSVPSIVALSIALIFLGIGAPKLPNNGRLAAIRYIVDHAREKHSYGLPQGNGYYETLMAAKELTPSILTPIQWLMSNKQDRTRAGASEIYINNDFLLYEARPNLNLENTVEGPVKTNSHGFFDDEHLLFPPPATRRIAIFGDSVVRGYGVSMDKRFSSLLEKYLSTRNERFEVLNFAIPGYLLTQTFDEALNRPSIFHPNVYILTMTDMTGGPTWGYHIMKLVNANRDLKYNALRDIVRQSGIRKGDSFELGRYKLYPYRARTMRALILELKKHVEQQSAKLVIFLVPSGAEGSVIDASFSATKECLQNTGVPVIDASDALYNNDVDRLRLDWFDQHPNAEGHRKIAKRLYEKLRQNPDAWADITGEPLHPAQP